MLKYFFFLNIFFFISYVENLNLCFSVCINRTAILAGDCDDIFRCIKQFSGDCYCGAVSNNSEVGLVAVGF
jgi:hypothetical protein